MQKSSPASQQTASAIAPDGHSASKIEECYWNTYSIERRPNACSPSIKECLAGGALGVAVGSAISSVLSYYKIIGVSTGMLICGTSGLIGATVESQIIQSGRKKTDAPLRVAKKEVEVLDEVKPLAKKALKLAEDSNEPQADLTMALNMIHLKKPDISSEQLTKGILETYNKMGENFRKAKRGENRDVSMGVYNKLRNDNLIPDLHLLNSEIENSRSNILQDIKDMEGSLKT